MRLYPTLAALTVAAPLLAACGREEPAPIVFRGSDPQGAAPATAPAAAAPTPSVETAALPPAEGLPQDARGVVDYGGYSAVTARSGDTVEAMARRVGLGAAELASYNGLPTNWRPEPGDELILPPREGGYASAAPAPAAAAGGLDLDRLSAELAPPPQPAPAQPQPEPQPQSGPEPRQVAVAAPEPAPAPAQPEARFSPPVAGEVLRPFSRAPGPQRNNGVDFAANPGEPVTAAADGRVALITQPVGLDGAIVMIDHGDDLLAIYGRLEDIRVEKDQRVSRGETLGVVAPSSSGDRAYLQFEVIKGAEAVDPADYLG